MAKIPFSKLGLKKNEEVKSLDFNNQKIEIKQYLPIDEKVDLVTKILTESEDDNKFINLLKVELIMTLEIIMVYTNISFTEKQKEDSSKLYDLLTGSGLVEQIFDLIPEEELDYIISVVWDMLDEIYAYSNSAMGIVENISTNYDKLNFDSKNLQEAIKDPDNLALLKDVLTKLG